MPVTAPDLTPSAPLSPASAIATASTETPVPGMDPVAVARWHTHLHRTSPWLHRLASERRMVCRFTPNCSASACSEGRRWPGG